MTHASFSSKYATCVEEEVICRRQFVCQQPRQMFVLTIPILLTRLCLFFESLYFDQERIRGTHPHVYQLFKLNCHKILFYSSHVSETL